MLSPNQTISDTGSCNMSKYPIHRTYLTDNAQHLFSGVYQIKAHEVWSSARSGKISIGIRSLKWISKQIYLLFSLIVQITSTIDAIDISMVVPPYTKTQTELKETKKQCNNCTIGNHNGFLIDISYTNKQIVIKTIPSVTGNYTIYLIKT